MGRKKKKYYKMIKKINIGFWLAMFLFVMVPVSVMVYGGMIKNDLILYFGCLILVSMFMIGAFINDDAYTMKRKYMDNVKVSYTKKKKRGKKK